MIFKSSSPRVARSFMSSWPCGGSTLNARLRISLGIGSGKLLAMFSWHFHGFSSLFTLGGRSTISFCFIPSLSLSLFYFPFSIFFPHHHRYEFSAFNFNSLCKKSDLTSFFLSNGYLRGALSVVNYPFSLQFNQSG